MSSREFCRQLPQPRSSFTQFILEYKFKIIAFVIMIITVGLSCANLLIKCQFDEPVLEFNFLAYNESELLDEYVL